MPIAGIWGSLDGVGPPCQFVVAIISNDVQTVVLPIDMIAICISKGIGLLSMLKPKEVARRVVFGEEHLGMIARAIGIVNGPIDVYRCFDFTQHINVLPHDDEILRGEKLLPRPCAGKDTSGPPKISI